MNYAIQSGSINVVEYIYSRDYGLTPSNFITAIRQDNLEILEFISDQYSKKKITIVYYLLFFNLQQYL